MCVFSRFFGFNFRVDFWTPFLIKKRSKNDPKRTSPGAPPFSTSFAYRPLGAFSSIFGSLLVPFGVPLLPFGLILAPLWLQLGSFGVLLASHCSLLGSFWWPCGSSWGPLVRFWLDFGTLWLRFGRFGRHFQISLLFYNFVVRTLSSLGPRAELLPQATEI